MENFIHYNREIVGSGWIAHDMANALIQENIGIYGVASGHYSSAKSFLKNFQLNMSMRLIKQCLKMKI